RSVGLAQRQLDTGFAQAEQGLGGIRVAADGADHPHVCPEASGGDGLVRALAAGDPVECGAAERLPRPRQPLDLRDEVEVDRADDGHGRAHAGILQRGTMSWSDFERAAPSLARAAQARLEATRVALLGTIRAD